MTSLVYFHAPFGILKQALLTPLSCTNGWQPNRFKPKPLRPGLMVSWAYNRPMDYQLVIKFWRRSLSDEAFLATIEGELKQALGDAVELEGYDVSPKEINLFMLTADPRNSFRRARGVLERLGVEHGISAAFRLVGGAQFTSIWPLRVTRKFKLP
jgi:hypothetical protein